MVRFRCGRFPTGTVHIRTPAGSIVDFHDGVADVDDPDLAQALLEVPEVFGITADQPLTPVAVAGGGAGGEQEPPTERSSKPEWVEWAVAHGVDRADAEGMSKAAIADRLAELADD